MPPIGYDLPKKQKPGEAVSLGYADVGTGIRAERCEYE